jgi:hypothetical protein
MWSILSVLILVIIVQLLEAETAVIDDLHSTIASTSSTSPSTSTSFGSDEETVSTSYTGIVIGSILSIFALGMALLFKCSKTKANLQRPAASSELALQGMTRTGSHQKSLVLQSPGEVRIKELRRGSNRVKNVAQTLPDVGTITNSRKNSYRF